MVGGPAGEVTLLLAGVRGRDKDAMERLVPLVYDELRRLAAGYLRHERPSHTLQPTALVHEAFLRLVDQDQAGWQNRAHFIGIAARMMRRLLVDYARRRSAAKRSLATGLPVDLSSQGCESADPERILAVDEVLGRLAELDPQQERIVELRYFGGLSVEETAEALQISPRTVKRDWAMAKAWLKQQLAAGAAK
jgi:RNA polymerase sigma factor (TIGR02999 family)